MLIQHRQLKTLLSPRSVAVVGVSHESQKIGAIVLRNIISGGFTGKIFPINPAGGTIQELPAYADYYSLPITPDLAVVAVPAVAVPSVLQAIGQKGTKNVIILSAGFKEMGESGRIAEEELVAIAKKYNLALVGPNCLGIINSSAKLNATFGQSALLPGNLRFISQSGAIATSFFDWAGECGLGFGEFITLGNKAVINENDILDEWLSQRPPNKTLIKKSISEGLSPYQPIGLYLESIINGQKLLKSLKQISRRNPVFILKPGKSVGAQKAMMSHTGSIAGDDAVLGAVLDEVGVVHCHGMEDLFDVAKAFAWERAPTSPAVAVVSNAGGPAVISADLITEAGLKIASLSQKTQTILKKSLPPAAGINDPIDILGDALADRYSTAINTVLSDSNVSALIVILTPQITTQTKATAEIISTASKKFGKPIITTFIGGTQVAEGESILNDHKIPCYTYPDRAIWVLGKMWAWEKWRQNQSSITARLPRQKTISRPVQKILNIAKSHTNTTLSPLQADELLSAGGLITPGCIAANDIKIAEKFLALHKKIVLKISSNKLLHKTEEHGVIVNIDTDEKLHQAWVHLTAIIQKNKSANSDAIIMAQQQIVGGIELIVGVKNDSTFGKILLFGGGGTMVELIADRNLHTLPISEQEINTLIKQSKINAILTGYRGSIPYSTKKLIKTIVRLVTIASAPEISEIEINPLIITAKETYAVDGKVLLNV